MRLILWARYAVTVLIICLFFGVTLSSTLQNMPIKQVTANVGGLYTKEQVLIVDAGHGGEDGGAVSITGEYESDINLSISRKLKLLAIFLGQPVIMTRESDSIAYPESANTTRERKVSDQKNRVALINSADNAVLISIHQNKFSSPSPFGTQVFFAPTCGSEAFGTYLQDIFLSQIDPTNRRTAAKIPDNIYLMNSIKCPALLIECGFLSNEREARLLKDPTYQKKLAMVIAGGFSSYSEKYCVNGDTIINEN